MTTTTTGTGRPRGAVNADSFRRRIETITQRIAGTPRRGACVANTAVYVYVVDADGAPRFVRFRRRPALVSLRGFH